jgi:hypothetical protein
MAGICGAPTSAPLREPLACPRHLSPVHAPAPPALRRCRVHLPRAPQRRVPDTLSNARAYGLHDPRRSSERTTSRTEGSYRRSLEHEIEVHRAVLLHGWLPERVILVSDATTLGQK